jgi:hypothetical protein
MYKTYVRECVQNFISLWNTIISFFAESLSEFQFSGKFCGNTSLFAKICNKNVNFRFIFKKLSNKNWAIQKINTTKTFWNLVRLSGIFRSGYFLKFMEPFERFWETFLSRTNFFFCHTFKSFYQLEWRKKNHRKLLKLLN